MEKWNCVEDFFFFFFFLAKQLDDLLPVMEIRRKSRGKVPKKAGQLARGGAGAGGVSLQSEA